MNAPRLLLGLLLASLLAGGLWLLLGQQAGPPQMAGLERQLPSNDASRSAPAEELAVAGDDPEQLTRSEPQLEARPMPSRVDRAEHAKRFIRGRVIDGFGSPIGGARVVFASEAPPAGVHIDELIAGGAPWVETEETSTAADGSYRLDLSWRGRLSIAVRSPGFAPLRVERELEPGAETTLADLVLEEGVVLSGHIVDSSGIGVGGARLVDRRLASSSAFSFFSEHLLPLAVTDDIGAFTIDELPAGPYRLGVEHDAYPTTLATGHIARAGERKTGERYILVDGLEISGRLLGLEAQQAGSFVVRARPSHQADSDVGKQLDVTRSAGLDAAGNFTLRGLRGGLSYRLRAIFVEGDGVAPSPASVASSVVSAIAGESGVELELLGSQALTFRVVDGLSGEPLTEFKVDAGSSRMRALRDAMGQRIVLHPGGQVRYQDISTQVDSEGVNLRIAAHGYVTLNRTGITLAHGKDTDLGVLRLEPAPMISVRVIDAQTGESVRHAKVGLRRVREGSGLAGGSLFLPGGKLQFNPDEELRWVSTNEQGVAELASLHREHFELLVRHKSYARKVAGPFSSPAVASALPDKPDFEVALSKGGTVIVHVVDAKGEPQQGVEVDHRSPGQERQALIFGGADGQKSRADGTVTYRHLAPGVHHFKLTETGSSSIFGGGGILIASPETTAMEGDASQEVLVSEGSEDEVTLRGKPRGALEGKVSEDGEPLAGALVTFTEKRDDGGDGSRFAGLGIGETTRKTNSKGEYSGLDLKVGEYTARVSHPTRCMAESYTVVVTEGRQSCDFALSVTTIEGRVVDSEGRGVSGVKVKPKRHREQESSRIFMASVFVEGEGGGGLMTFNPGHGALPEVFTDPNGNYSLRGVVPDVELYVESSHAAYQAARSEVIKAREGQTLGGVDIRVLEAGSVQVQVVLPVGESLTLYMLSASYQEESDKPVGDETVLVDERGSARLQNLHPGRWKLIVRQMRLGSEPDDSGGTPSSEPVIVEVLAGETQTVTLELP